MTLGAVRPGRLPSAAAASAPETTPEAAPGAGFLPASALFGSQLRFFSVSAASCDCERAGTFGRLAIDADGSAFTTARGQSPRAQGG